MPTTKDTQAAGAATLTGPEIFWFPQTEQFSIRSDGDTPFVRGWQRLYTHAQALALASTATAPSAPTDICMTKAGRNRIDAAADALSKVLAFVPMPAYVDEVSRALSGLRALQAAPNAPDSAAPSSLSAEPVSLEFARAVIGAGYQAVLKTLKNGENDSDAAANAVRDFINARLTPPAQAPAIQAPEAVKGGEA